MQHTDIRLLISVQEFSFFRHSGPCHPFGVKPINSGSEADIVRNAAPAIGHIKILFHCVSNSSGA